MADPKEDQGKYPATDHRVEAEEEREAALRGEAPGGHTGRLLPMGVDRAPTGVPFYGPDDRQRYLEDVAKRAFAYENPLQGPLTAYEAA